MTARKDGAAIRLKLDPSIDRVFRSWLSHHQMNAHDWLRSQIASALADDPWVEQAYPDFVIETLVHTYGGRVEEVERAIRKRILERDGEKDDAVMAEAILEKAKQQVQVGGLDDGLRRKAALLEIEIIKSREAKRAIILDHRRCQKCKTYWNAGRIDLCPKCGTKAEPIMDKEKRG